MAKIYKAPSSKGSRLIGPVLGIAASALLFLAIPLTQLLTDYKKTNTLIEVAEVAPPPPPPPPLDEPPPPPEAEEEPPPQFDSPPPPVTLEQLDLAMEIGTGGSLAGDFALPTINLTQNLGSLDIFDISDLEKKPVIQKQIAPQYPIEAKMQKISGFALAEFIIDTKGNVIDVKILESSNKVFDRPTTKAISSWKFTPGEKDGKAVKTRTRVRIPYQLKD